MPVGARAGMRTRNTSKNRDNRNSSLSLNKPRELFGLPQEDLIPALKAVGDQISLEFPGAGLIIALIDPIGCCWADRVLFDSYISLTSPCYNNSKVI